MELGKSDSNSSEDMPFPDNFMPDVFNAKPGCPADFLPTEQGRTSLEMFQASFRDSNVSSFFPVI